MEERVVSHRKPLHESDHIDIWHDVGGGYLYVDWKGPQTAASVQAGCELILQHMIDNRLTKCLNDNTNVVGTWEEASHWVAKEFLPRAQRAGVCCIAWVQSPSRGSRRAANATALDAKQPDLIHLFDDLKTAELWLRESYSPS